MLNQMSMKQHKTKTKTKSAKKNGYKNKKCNVHNLSVVLWLNDANMRYSKDGIK